VPWVGRFFCRPTLVFAEPLGSGKDSYAGFGIVVALCADRENEANPEPQAAVLRIGQQGYTGVAGNDPPGENDSHEKAANE
jgi:hypothetical protein